MAFINFEMTHKRDDLHLARKFWHIGCGSIGLIAYYNLGQSQLFWSGAAGIIALIGFSLDFLRLKNEKFNQLFMSYATPLMRSSEKSGFSGLPFYALGVSLAFLLYQKEIAELAILFLVFADPFSSFIGVMYGKDKILPNKTLQGTIAGFFVCYLITLIYLFSSSAKDIDLIIFAAIAGIIGSVSELFSAFNIDDNLTIPVVAGAGLTLLNSLWVPCTFCFAVAK